MSKRQKKHEHVNHERWLVSYADFITLLFAFFVVMFSVGQTDRSKLERFVDSVNVAFRMNGVFPDTQGSPLSRGGVGTSIVPPVVHELPSFFAHSAASPRAAAVFESLEQALRAAGLEGKVSLRHDRRGVVASLPDWVLFPAGQATLRPEAAADLAQLADAIHGEPVGAVQIECHTDDLEPSKAFESNWELSATRAARVARYFADQGFDPALLSAAGFADSRPLVENANEESRGRNRRIDVVLVTEMLEDGG